MLSNLKQDRPLNLAPCIDFLFILLVIFATAAISREVARTTQVNLVRIEQGNQKPSAAPHKSLVITVDPSGHYIWNAQLKDYPMPSAQSVQKELRLRKKSTSHKNERPVVYLRIDAKAPWSSVATLITAIEEVGFSALPLLQDKVYSE